MLKGAVNTCNLTISKSKQSKTTHIISTLSATQNYPKIIKIFRLKNLNHKKLKYVKHSNLAVNNSRNHTA